MLGFQIIYDIGNDSFAGEGVPVELGLGVEAEQDRGVMTLKAGVAQRAKKIEEVGGQNVKRVGGHCCPRPECRRGGSGALGRGALTHRGQYGEPPRRPTDTPCLWGHSPVEPTAGARAARRWRPAVCPTTLSVCRVW